MDKMSLIVYAKTGHVLGAFTRTVDPEGVVTADRVVGPALHVRDPGSGEVLAHVEPQHLKVEIVDRRDDVILLHRRYIVEDGVPVERASLAATAVTYADPDLTITLGTAPAEDIEAWVQLEDGASQPIVTPVDISAAAASGTVPLTLTAGTRYNVLAVVPGFRALTGTLTA